MSNTFEILARGRSLFNSDWYEGDVSHHKNGSVSIRPIENNPTGTGYYVEAETVTPYVQRTDKNGKKVFLGDIVRHCVDDLDGFFLVGYNDKSCSFSINSDLCEFLPSQREFSEECEVVGNKWDNPELLLALGVRDE